MRMLHRREENGQSVGGLWLHGGAFLSSADWMQLCCAEEKRLVSGAVYFSAGGELRLLCTVGF